MLQVVPASDPPREFVNNDAAVKGIKPATSGEFEEPNSKTKILMHFCHYFGRFHGQPVFAHM
ncbi:MULTISPECIES: hypothetical protein [unclassified Thalassospira]|uniref:hypothetical protein n=1 Tax=unclassified Thalassospira TaxID=2648997 RepID=UPI0011814330|nr:MULTISPECIES: hypothetical protein [unclassified Thalassospira]